MITRLDFFIEKSAYIFNEITQNSVNNISLVLNQQVLQIITECLSRDRNLMTQRLAKNILEKNGGKRFKFYELKKNA